MSAPAINRTPAHAMAAAAAAGASSPRDVAMAPQWRGGPGGKAGDTLAPSPQEPARGPRPSGPVPAALQSYLDQIEKKDSPDDAPGKQAAPTLPALPKAPLGIVGSAFNLLGAIPAVIAAKLDEAATALDQVAQQSREAAQQGKIGSPAGDPGLVAHGADHPDTMTLQSDAPPRRRPEGYVSKPRPDPEGALFSSDTDKPIMPPSLSALTSAPGLKKGETA